MHILRLYIMYRRAGWTVLNAIKQTMKVMK